MKIKNKENFLKKIKIVEGKGIEYVVSLRTSNYGNECYSFTSLDEIKEELKTGNEFTLKRWGIWDTKRNGINFDDSIKLWDLFKIKIKE